MEWLEFVFDYIIHIFDFIKNEIVRTIVQIVSMIILTTVLVLIILGATKLILWLISKK